MPTASRAWRGVRALLGELPPWEAHLWRTPQLSAHQRRILIEITRELDRRLG